MIVDKVYRRMTTAETLDFFPSSETVLLVDETISQLEKDLPENYFSNEVAAGRMKAAVIRIDDIPSYCVVYQIQLEGKRFYVCASISMRGGISDARQLFIAVELMAKSCGCKSAVFATERKGLVLKSLAAGYTVAGVEMRKEIA